MDILSPAAQVAAYLRNELINQRWGQELPGTPALATDLEVDRKTIIAALNILEEEGRLESQGPGRPRRITLNTSTQPTRLKVRIIPYDEQDRQFPHIHDMQHLLQQSGHAVYMTKETLSGMHMKLDRIKQVVEKYPADCWIIMAGSGEVLEWFASQKKPAFAMGGRRRDLDIASIGPDKSTAIRAAVDQLAALGHRRIVMMTREERRKPNPGAVEREFLKALEKYDITAGSYHLPDWEHSPASFHDCLDRMFTHTPPTALLVDGCQFFIAAQQHLAQRGLSAPKDISLVCTEPNLVFDWCQPQVASFKWDTQPIINEVRKWVNQLSKGINNRKTRFVPTEFIKGGTIGPAAPELKK